MDYARADLHFHILPGVDDGPRTVDESMELAELALRDGTGTVIATPHVRTIDPVEVPARVDDLRGRLHDRGLRLELGVGGELAADDLPDLSDVQLGAIAQGPPDARWILLEAPLPQAAPDVGQFTAATAELRARGFGVLVGHPERSPGLFDDDAAALRAEVAAGSVLQLNASSLTGGHGEEERARGLALVRDGLPAVVASDAHRATRGPGLSAALDALLDAGIAEPAARDLTDVGPRALLEGGLGTRVRGA